MSCVVSYITCIVSFQLLMVSLYQYHIIINVIVITAVVIVLSKLSSTECYRYS